MNETKDIRPQEAENAPEVAGNELRQALDDSEMEKIVGGVSHDEPSEAGPPDPCDLDSYDQGGVNAAAKALTGN